MSDSDAQAPASAPLASSGTPTGGHSGSNSGTNSAANPGQLPQAPAPEALPASEAALALQKGGSAGTMLRRAREAAGIAPPEMATLLKVSEKKLAALEEDRFNDLPDLAFARALAKSICKQLKVEAEPVLQALPRLNVFQGVEHSDVALNMPYRDRSLSAGYSSSRGDMAWMRRKSVWGTAAVLLLIAGMFAVSPDVLKRFASTPKPTVTALSDGTTVDGAAPVVSTAATLPAPGAPTVADQVLAGQTPAVANPAAAAAGGAAAAGTDPAAAVSAPADGSAPAAAVAGGPGVRLQATQEVWVQVMSGRKRIFERTLQPGETVDVPGEAPLRIVAGRAAAVTVTHNGQALVSTARGSVGRYRVDQ